MLEWTDDLEVFILKGYGKSLNYRMGVPLLEDVVQSMEQAIQAKEGENKYPGFLFLYINVLLIYPWGGSCFCSHSCLLIYALRDSEILYVV